MDFPVVGKTGPVWTLPEDLVTEWRDCYPNLDLDDELRRARAWCLANPLQRKTARGMPRFLVNWFNRSVDRYRASRPPIRPRPEHWTEECKREHHLRCIHQSEHRIRMYQQQEKANAPDVA